MPLVKLAANLFKSGLLLAGVPEEAAGPLVTAAEVTAGASLQKWLAVRKLDPHLLEKGLAEAIDQAFEAIAIGLASEVGETSWLGGFRDRARRWFAGKWDQEAGKLVKGHLVPLAERKRWDEETRKHFARDAGKACAKLADGAVGKKLAPAVARGGYEDLAASRAEDLTRQLLAELANQKDGKKLSPDLVELLREGQLLGAAVIHFFRRQALVNECLYKTLSLLQAETAAEAARQATTRGVELSATLEQIARSIEEIREDPAGGQELREYLQTLTTGMDELRVEMRESFEGLHEAVAELHVTTTLGQSDLRQGMREVVDLVQTALRLATPELGGAAFGELEKHYEDIARTSPHGTPDGRRVVRGARRHGASVVLKILQRTERNQGDWAELAARTVREGLSLFRLKGRTPYVVDIHDMGIGTFERKLAVFLELERVPGTDLVTAGKHGPLAPERLPLLARHLSAAVTACHELGVFHRDVAPQNVMQRELAGEPSYLLIDFELAKTEEMAPLTRTGQLPGTDGCVPPDEVLALLPEERRVAYRDVYGVAATIYYAACGRVPPRDPASCTSVLGPRVPAWLASLVLTCLFPPKDRDAQIHGGQQLHDLVAHEGRRRLPGESELYREARELVLGATTGEALRRAAARLRLLAEDGSEGSGLAALVLARGYLFLDVGALTLAEQDHYRSKFASERAESILQDAVAAGDPLAQVALAEHLGPSDEALTLLRTAAQQGHPWAQLRLQQVNKKPEHAWKLRLENLLPMAQRGS